MQLRTTAQYAFEGQYATAINLPPEIEPGDTVVIFVWGGNRVTSYNGSWTFLDYQSGEEAQGSTLSKVVTSRQEYFALQFDGYDPQRWALIAFQGPVGIQVMSAYREGVAGQVEGPTEWVPNFERKSIDWTAYFVGNRNATDPPTSSLGAAEQRYDGMHTMGLWIEPPPTGMVDFQIPERSGSYRVAIRAYEFEVSEWDYAAELIQEVHAWNDTTPGYGVTSHHRVVDPPPVVTSMGQVAALMQGIWAGGGVDFPDFNMKYGPHVGHQITVVGSTARATASWWQTHLLLERTETITVDQGELPSTVVNPDGSFVDPLVTGVQWEPQSEPDFLTMWIRILRLAPANSGVNGFAIPNTALGTEMSVHMVEDDSRKTRDQLVATPVLGTVPIASLQSLQNQAEFDVEVPGSGPLAFTISMVDHFTETGQVVTIPMDGSARFNFIYTYEVELRGYYRPRYRLLYGEYLPPPPVAVIDNEFDLSRARFTRRNRK